MERGNWTGKLDFILSCVGYAVGLGNVWRFPYLAYQNGGASFLFPYIIMLVVAGLPLFFLELAIGQFTSEGPVTCWRMAPAFMGIGYGMVIISAVVSIYYNMIIAYAMYYMLVSFVYMDGGLPWESCENDWNTKKCRYEAMPKMVELNQTQQWTDLWGIVYDQACVYTAVGMNDGANTTHYDFNVTSPNYMSAAKSFLDQFKVVLNDTNWQPVQIDDFDYLDDCETSYTTPTEEYYKYYLLDERDVENLDDIGSISLKLLFTLLFAWLLIFVCLQKGIKTSGKVVYFTATFPYVVLIVLLIRGVTLEGHEEGIDFYIIPDWDKLTDATIWGDAATQIFYSLGIGFGGLLTMASYNKFNNNVFRDAVLVAVINCGTSIFAGFAIFSLLGHMAYVTNKDVENVADSGAGLAFIAYPDGISRLPSSPIWAFLFFFMLLTLGMDSQFAMMETVISAISDIFPNTLRKYKTPFTLATCAVGFLLGIPLCTEGGGRVLDLMNNYSGSYNLMIIALFEIICLCYVYGIKEFRQDIEMMIGVKSNGWWAYWLACWMAITPAAVIFIVVVSAVQYETPSYNSVEILDWAEGIGWLMVTVPIAVMLLVMLIQMCRLGVKNSLSPMPRWGPAEPENQIGRYAHLRTSPDYNEMAGDLANGNGEKALNGKGGFDNLAHIDERL